MGRKIARVACIIAAIPLGAALADVGMYVAIGTAMGDWTIDRAFVIAFYGLFLGLAGWLSYGN